MEGFTENDFKILKSILNRGDKLKGLSIMNGTTIAEIVEKTGLSDKKVRITIKRFIELGYVTQGLSKVRTKTYLLTKEGLLVIKSIRKNILGEDVKNE